MRTRRTRDGDPLLPDSREPLRRRGDGERPTWILDHDDEQARRFEEYEPSEADERPGQEYLLQPAELARARSERQIVNAVAAARSAGISWARIGHLLGTSPPPGTEEIGTAINGTQTYAGGTGRFEGASGQTVTSGAGFGAEFVLEYVGTITY